MAERVIYGTLGSKGLKKVTAGNIDILAAAKALKEPYQKIIIILLFDEMYLQKCEECCGGDTFGTNEDGELYKGIMCFMLIGSKNNVTFIIKTIPETKIEGELIQNEILHCFQVATTRSWF